MNSISAWPWLLGIFLTAAFCQGGEPDENARVAISGRVIDDQSRGVPGVEVRGFAYSDVSETTTDADGRFVLNVLEERLRQLAVVADDAGSDRMGTYKAEWSEPPTTETSIAISLAACRQLPVEVKDAAGEFAADVRVGAVVHYAPLVSVVTDADGKAVLRLPSDAKIQSLYAVKSDVGFDYKVVQTPRDETHRVDWFHNPPVQFQFAGSQTVRIGLVDTDERPVVGLSVYLWLLNKPDEPDSFNLSFTPTLFRATTDDAGVAEFRGVPDWDVRSLTFWPSTDEYVRERITFGPNEHPDGLMTVKLDRLVPVSGSVELAEGRPAAGIRVSAVGDGYELNDFSGETTTDQHGRFEIRVAPNLLYMFAVQDEQWATGVIDGLIVRPDEPIMGLKFELRPATRIHGRVTVGPDEKPVAGQRMGLRQEGRDLHHLEGAELPNPENSRTWIQPSVYRSVVTDEKGYFQFFVGPGKFTLSGPSQVKPEKFEVAAQSELEFHFAAPRPETGPFSGRVVTGSPPRPVPDALIEGKYRAFVSRDLRLRADEQGQFSSERSLHRTVLYAKSPNGELAGIVEIGPDTEEATIPVASVASAKARLVDTETGDPLPETEVQWGRNVHQGDDDAPWEVAWGGTITTDAAGFFEIGGLVVGQEYSLSVPRGDGSYGVLPSFTPKTADSADLGDLRLKPPYKPPTFQERVDRELASDSPVGERYARALGEAERLRQHVLVVFLDRDGPLAESWFKLRFDDRAVRSALHDYQLLQIDLKTQGAAELAERLGVAIDAEKLPAWQFGSPAGEAMQTGSVPREEETVDRAALLESLGRNSPAPLDARKLLEEALAEAAVSNRRVIVQETATWCGPCHMLARYLERHRSIWEKDYLWVRIDERWNGSEEVMKRFRESHGGIPWFAILDGEGKVLATSDGPDGNIGFPGEPAGIDHFVGMLKSTRQRLSDDDLTVLRQALESR